jgi:hypothetical protein
MCGENRQSWYAQRCQWHRCAHHTCVNDSAVHVTAVPMTPLCMSHDVQPTLSTIFAIDPIQYCFFYAGIWFGCTRHSGDFTVDFLREFEAIFKKALTRVSGAYGELFDEKNQRSKFSCQGPFKNYSICIKYIGDFYVVCPLNQPPDWVSFIINFKHDKGPQRMSNLKG